MNIDKDQVLEDLDTLVAEGRLTADDLMVIVNAALKAKDREYDELNGRELDMELAVSVVNFKPSHRFGELTAPQFIAKKLATHAVKMRVPMDDFIRKHSVN